MICRMKSILPLLQVIRFSGFDEAIRLRKSNPVWFGSGTVQPARGIVERFLLAARAGIVNWNKPLTGAQQRSPLVALAKVVTTDRALTGAADYCAYPVAPLESGTLSLPESLSPGVNL